MLSLRKSLIASSLLLSLASASVIAAQPISAEKSQTLLPLKEISVRGQFNFASDAEGKIAAEADAQGAKFYYIKGIEEATTSATAKVAYADIYVSDTQTVAVKQPIHQIGGVYQYTPSEAFTLVSYDKLTITGNFNNLADITTQAAKAAADKGAYAFYVEGTSSMNSSGTRSSVDVMLFAKEAKQLDILKSAQVSNRCFELTEQAAKTMKPKGSIVLHGNYNSLADITTAAARHAESSGAKYYYITSISERNTSGSIKDVDVNLY